MGHGTDNVLDRLCRRSQIGGDKSTARSQAELIPISRKFDAPIAHHFGSATDEVEGRVLVEAASPPGVLSTVRFGACATDEGLDIVAPVVVEGVLTVIRHPARGEFPAVVEL